MGVNLKNNNGGVGSEIGLYTNKTPLPADFGNLKAGTTFDHVPISDLLTMILYPYQYPSFSSFYISGQSNNLEVGDKISANKTFTWVTSNASNIEAGSITIRDITNGVTLATGLSNTGSVTVTMSEIRKTTVTSNTFRISGINTNGQTFTKDYTVNWGYRKYYGENAVASLNSSSILSLRVGSFASTFTGSYDFEAGGYKCLCFPDSWGAITTMRDSSNNFLVSLDDPYVVDVVNSFGVTVPYKVYTTYNIIGGSLSVVVS